MKTMRVESDTLRPNLCLYPTVPPTGSFNSAATRSATVTAASRLGWVQAIRRPSAPQPSSMSIFGSWVVLPDPVSPHTTTTGLPRIAARISSRCSQMGSSGG